MSETPRFRDVETTTRLYQDGSMEHVVGLLVEGERTNHIRHSEGAPSQALRLEPGDWVLTVYLEGWVEILKGQGVELLTKRSWWDRLLSWPWRPWEKHRRRARPPEGEWGFPPRSVRFSVPEEAVVRFEASDPPPKGVQLEQGAFPSSYIQTEGRPVTRKADEYAVPFPPQEASVVIVEEDDRE